MKNEKKIKEAMEQTNARTVPTLNGGTEYEYTVGGITGYTSNPEDILKDLKDFQKQGKNLIDYIRNK